MNAAVNFDKITNVLKGDDNIVFALVFGFQANGKANQLSDVDIGIFTKDDISLLRLAGKGQMRTFLTTIRKSFSIEKKSFTTASNLSTTGKKSLTTGI